MLRLATDRECWPDDLPLAPILRPLLGETDVRPGATSWDERFEGYADAARSLFELSSIADADYVVMPGDWYWVRGTSWRSGPHHDLVERVRPLEARAQRAGKPVLVFFTGDRSSDRVPFPQAHVFRESAFASRLGKHDHPMPAFPEDLVAHHCDGAVVERPWRPRPTIGFCGLASPKPLWRRAAGLAAYHTVVGFRERRFDPSPYLGEVLRADAVALLERCPDIDTNFVLRGEKVFFKDADTRDLVDVRTEYVNNIRDSDYVLCIRGSGNYSYRLYEAMCMGRIPVIVDTDLALPCADTIEWTRLAVWVDQHNLHELPDRINEFHSRLAGSGFVHLQHELRSVWTDKLSPAGFFAQLARSIGALA
jgi:hypothetical protein